MAADRLAIKIRVPWMDDLVQDPTLCVELELTPELCESIGRICDERIAAAVKRAQETRASGDRKGSNPPPPASPKPEPPANPPPPPNRALDVGTCTKCAERKMRGYFSEEGWQKGICGACELLGFKETGQQEPDTPEWNAARLLVPGIFDQLAKLRPVAEGVKAEVLERLHGRAAAAAARFDHVEIHAIKEALAAIAAGGD